ncbi:TPA: hypothetical protein ACXJSP_000189 [Pseudomonas aeruginosa]
MTESKICTCPSGDGSLRWPCPKHPAVEQAGGDERAVFEAYRDRRNALLESEGHKPGSKWHVTNAHYPTWEASRAALAQPSPPPHPAPELDFSRPLETENGDPVKWICADVIEYKSAHVCVAKDTGLVYSSPYIGLKIRNVMPEQAEAERPEVVAFRYHCTNAEGEPLPGWFYSDDAGTLGLREPLMTVAQHERILRKALGDA